MATDKVSVKACCEDDADLEGTHSAYCDYNEWNRIARIERDMRNAMFTLVPYTAMGPEPEWVFPDT